MKYIVIKIADKEAIFVFPRAVDHDRFAEGIGAIRMGPENNWNRSLRSCEVISAGFIDAGQCGGYSETLEVGARVIEDNALLATHFPSPKLFCDDPKQFFPHAPAAMGSCGCETCRPITILDMRMVLCPICGNKRCPKARNHINDCTGSNDVGQRGSAEKEKLQKGV